METCVGATEAGRRAPVPRGPRNVLELSYGWQHASRLTRAISEPQNCRCGAGSTTRTQHTRASAFHTRTVLDSIFTRLYISDRA